MRKGAISPIFIYFLSLCQPILLLCVVINNDMRNNKTGVIPMKHPFIRITVLNILLVAAIPVMADDVTKPLNPGEQINARLDQRGENINQRLDQRGENINARLDQRAAKAAENGHERLANRLDNKGDRIEKRLDSRGDRIERRMDRKGDRIERRMTRRRDRVQRRNREQ